jgi:hypothetical protein
VSVAVAEAIAWVGVEVDFNAAFKDLTVTTAPEPALVVRRVQIFETLVSEVATAPAVKLPKATVPPFPENDPEQAVPEAWAPTLKVIDGSIDAVMEIWSSVTVVTAKVPVIPAEPPKVTKFDPAPLGLVPVNAVIVSAPAVQPVKVTVATLVLAVPEPTVPVVQVPVGVPAKAVKFAYVNVSVPLTVPAGKVMLTECPTLVTLTLFRSKTSFIPIAVPAAKTGITPYCKIEAAIIATVAIRAIKCFCFVFIFAVN